MSAPVVRRQARTALVATALVATALLAAAAACSEKATEPTEPLVVTASLANALQPIIRDATPVSPTLVRCAPQVRLNVAGEGRSLFTSGTIYRFTGASRVTPSDSALLSAAQLQQAFAATAILPGYELRATWTVDDSVPFSTRILIRHRVQGDVSDQQVAVDGACGPVPSPSSPAPEIANVSTTVPPGDFEPGDTIVVDYDVTAPLGVFGTTVRLSGPCDLAANSTQRLQTALHVEQRFAIPVTCTIGVPFSLRVTASDAGLRADTSEVVTSLRLVDHVAPSLSMVSLVQGAATTLFTGDSLYLWIFASDNLRLRWFTLGPPGGALDSVAIDAKVSNGEMFAFAARDSWVGSPYVALRAVDGAGNTSEERRFESGPFQFFRSTVRTSAARTLPGEIRELVVDRAGRSRVLVGDESVLRTFERGTLEPIVLSSLLDGASARLAAMPSGDSLVVMQPSTARFRVLDVREAVPVVPQAAVTVQGLDAAKGERPEALVVTARGTAFMIVSATAVADWRFVELNLTTGVTTRRDIGLTGAALTSTRLARSGDGRTVIVWAYDTGAGDCARRWTLDTDTFAACRSLQGEVPRSLDRTGASVLTNRRLFDATLATAQAVDFLGRNGGNQPGVLTPDGQTVYALHRDGLVRIRASDGATLELLRGTASLAGFSMERLHLSPDGTVAVMATASSFWQSGRIVTMTLP